MSSAGFGLPTRGTMNSIEEQVGRVAQSPYLPLGTKQQVDMAKAEQKYLVFKWIVVHLVAMLKEGAEKGASDEEIQEQAWEILDPQYRSKTVQSIKEMNEGRVKRFKSAERMIRDLESR